jgi:hypothetical protein
MTVPEVVEAIVQGKLSAALSVGAAWDAELDEEKIVVLAGDQIIATVRKESEANGFVIRIRRELRFRGIE